MDSGRREDLILELGSEFIRVGLVGDRAPRKTLKTANHFKGEAASQDKFLFSLENLLYDIFFVYVNSPANGRCVVLLLKVYFDRKVVQAVASLLFQKFKVEKIEFALACVSPLYLTCKYHGLVVSVGASTTEVMPVYEGIPLVAGFVGFSLGTTSLNRAIRLQLLRENPAPELQELVRAMTEDDLTDVRYQKFVSPTDNTVMVSYRRSKLRFTPKALPLEVLFDCADQREKHLANAVLRSLARIPAQCLDRVCGNVVLAGGLWRIPHVQRAFKKALLDELRLFPKLERTQVGAKLGTIAHAAFLNWGFNPCEISWIGCSVGASVRPVNCLILTKNDYLEHGFVDKLMTIYFPAKQALT